jgi:hypothetical protein
MFLVEFCFPVKLCLVRRNGTKIGMVIWFIEYLFL